MSNITRFPTGFERWKIRLGKFTEPCIVNSRWLAFSGTSSDIGAREVIRVDVMTGDSVRGAKKMGSRSRGKRITA